MNRVTTGLTVLLLMVMTFPLHAQTGWGVDRYEGFRASLNNQGNVSQIGWTTGNLGNAWDEGEWVPYCLSLKNVDMTVGASNFSPIRISYDFTSSNPAVRFVDLVRDIQVGISGDDYFPLGSNTTNDYGWPMSSGAPYPLTTAAQLATAQNNQSAYVWGNTNPWRALNLPNAQVNRDLTTTPAQYGGTGSPTDAEHCFTITYADLTAAGVSGTYQGDMQVYFNLHLSQTFIWSLSLQSQLDVSPTDNWGGYLYSISPYDTDSRNGSGYVPGASGHTTLLGPGSRTVSIPIPPAPQGQISGLKYYDANANSVKDGAESALEGWEIYISTSVGGTPISYTMITDASGAYSLTGLPGAVYTVSEKSQGPTPTSSPPPNYPYAAFSQSPPSTWDESYPTTSSSINSGTVLGTATSLAGIALGYADVSWSVDLISTSVQGDVNFGNFVPPPECEVSPQYAEVCDGDPVTFTAARTAEGTPPYTVTWSGPNSFTANTFTISFTASLASAGSYTAVLTDANGLSIPTGCSATLVVHPLPTVSVNSEAVCFGNSATLTATTNAQNPIYQWSSSGTVIANTPSITVTPTTTTTYTVTVTDGVTTCDNTATGTVTVYPLPACSITPTDPVCPNLTATHNGPPGMKEYLWSITGDGTISGANNQQTVSVDAANTCSGSYTLTLYIKDQNDCENTCSQQITIEDITPPSLTGTLPGGAYGNACKSAAPAAPSTATIEAEYTDNCGGTVTATLDQANSGVTGDDCAWTATYIYSVEDACQNSATATVIYTGGDTEGPTITVPSAPLTMECYDPSLVNSWAANASAVDNCSGSVSVTPSWTAPPDNCNRTVTVTFTAVDNCNNTSTATKDFLVDDVTAPVVTVPTAPLSMECYDESTVNAWAANASALDNCDGAVIVTPSWTAPPDNCNRTVTVTFTAVDNCGNTGTATKDFTVNDVTAPVVTAPTASLSMECYDASTVNAWAAGASAVDNCDGSVSVTPSWTAPPDNCNQTVTVTFTATDNCGNTGTATKDFTVNDVTGPVITVPVAALTMECYDASTVSTWAATASALDNCDGTVLVTPSWTAPPDNCNRTVTVTFTAVDNCGNSSTATKDFLVNDVSAPVITVPATSLSMECYDASLVNAWVAQASALDNCDGTVSVTPSWTAPPDNCNRTVTVTFTAVDNCGNNGTATKDFLVNDVTAPVVTVPAASLTMECYDASLVNAWAANASAVDNCDGTVLVTPSWTAPPDNCNRMVTVTFTAVDNCGNTGTATKDFTVNDVTGPVITVPVAALTMECYDASTVSTWAATASALDNCDGNVSVTPTWTAPPDNCNQTVTVTFTAVDNCGNTGTATKDFLVNDVTAPVVTVPAASLTMECYDASLVNAWAANASALDNCDGNVSVTPTWTAPPDNCNQTVTVTFTATDNCGNTGTATKDFTVNDVTAPVITVPPAALTMECYDASTVSTWAATASALDNCDGPVSVTPSWTAPPDNCNRTVTVTFTAVDNCGNTGTATKDFLVNDVTAPVVTVPSASLTMQCYDPSLVNAWAANASALDNCDGTVSVTPSWTAPPDNCNRTVTVTFTAVDNCGNTGTATKDFIVNDDTPPVLSGVPLDVTVECDAVPPAPSPGTVTSADICDPNPQVTMSETDTQDPDPAECGHYTYTITRTWTATDNCNNSSSEDQVITVQDTQTPIWVNSPPQDVEVPCATTPIPFWDPQLNIDYSDNCDPNPSLDIVIFHDIIPQPDGTKWHIRSWRVIDACNNISVTVQQTIVELRCQFATLTQGFYGNSGGTWCGNGAGTVTLLDQYLLTTHLVVGILKSIDPSSFGSFTVDATSGSSGYGTCIVQYLPSGGTAQTLPANPARDWSFSNPNNCNITPGNFPQLNNGRFHNILLGQTMTFALNLRLDPNLITDLELPTATAPYMWTYASDYVNNVCLDGNDVETGLPQYFYIPPAVITAVRTNYGSGLSDLLDFANDALAGKTTYNVTLTEITQALDAYNKGFDAARFFAGYHATPPPKSVVREPMPEDFALHQNHPNPFNPSTTITFTIPQESNVRLAVYNALGTEISVLLDRPVPAGTHAVTWNSNAAGTELPSGIYTYRIHVRVIDGEDFHDVKKMMLVK